MATEKMLCPCCKKEHEVQKVSVVETVPYEGVPVVYEAEYWYCEKTKEMQADNEQLAKNQKAMQDAYHVKMALRGVGRNPEQKKKN